MRREFVMAFIFDAACGSFIGVGRSNNQDNFYFNKKHLPIPNKGMKNPLIYRNTTDEPVVFAVFDGMGGECKGEEAACISSQVFSKECKKLEELAMSGKEFLYNCCDKANAEVNQLRQEQQLTATGTTVAAIYLHQDEAVACNVGDSKIFRIRDKKMLQISEDHTDEKIMSAMGIQKKAVLLQYIGVPNTEMAIEPFVAKGELVSGDIYVLCSDGITDAMTVSDMYEIICNFAADEAVKRVLAEVSQRQGTDNATMIVIKIA